MEIAGRGAHESRSGRCKAGRLPIRQIGSALIFPALLVTLRRDCCPDLHSDVGIRVFLKVSSCPTKHPTKPASRTPGIRSVTLAGATIIAAGTGRAKHHRVKRPLKVAKDRRRKHLHRRSNVSKDATGFTANTEATSISASSSLFIMRKNRCGSCTNSYAKHSGA